MYFLSMNLPCKLGVFPYNKIGQSTTTVVRLAIAYFVGGLSPSSQTVGSLVRTKLGQQSPIEK
jgi:hypothetical protein